MRYGMNEGLSACPTCNGTGELYIDTKWQRPCEECNGTGISGNPTWGLVAVALFYFIVIGGILLCR